MPPPYFTCHPLGCCKLCCGRRVRARSCKYARAPRITATPPSKRTPGDKAPREPSAYNIFMKSEIAKVKKDKPDLDHKSAFAEAASHWKDSKDNPKNK